ncbi:MAG TPA: 3-oxoacyl-ACP reductase family protein [Methylomirabilota bacterium]|nr:3-oxoacyl-ACP reductase family protein [Methylomirabilota bacterium]
MNGSGVAIVTGGSRGIGWAIARALADAGLAVVVNYREREREARALVEAITQAGGRAQAVEADVGLREAGQRLVRSTLEAFGQIDVLVNNAGVHLPGVPVADVPPDEWERVLRVNLSGPFHLIQAVLPHMRARRTGHIVNLSSNVTQRFPAAAGPYTVSKIGLEALTRVLAKEEGCHGIRVNAVAPGPIGTDMLDEALTVMGSERAGAFIASVPLGRKGRPEEIAAVVRFLVSDAASYLTGQVLYVNGGGPGG